MDKLVAIGKWLWLNKERFVLLVVMAVFCYRVYVVLNPPEPPAVAPPTSPRPGPIPDELMPPSPPMPPVRSLPGGYAGLYNNNPFCYYCKAKGPGGDDIFDPKKLGITLLAIRKLSDGRVRAQLNTTTVQRRWYNEGEQFEEYELQEIDPENNSVVIYSERYARRFTLTMEGG
ncbi:MAG TPA: hypothetical protein PLI09_24060 [Candidatus Hydrogenedentes bacterium]|nr:hypothetical protein [Candidatus Hydrogenedentota bacterium]